MSKRFDALIWSTGVASLVLAGCATSAPTTTVPHAVPHNQPAAYHTQGGAAAAPGGAPVAPPAQIYGVDGLGLFNYEYISSHPLLDYSWYANRGNLNYFGWAPGYYGSYGWGPGISTSYNNLMFYPLGNAWVPYSYNSVGNYWAPYSYQGYYPYFYGGLAYNTYGYPFWDYGLVSDIGLGVGFTGRRGFTRGRRGSIGRMGGRGMLGGRGLGGRIGGMGRR